MDWVEAVKMFLQDPHCRRAIDDAECHGMFGVRFSVHDGGEVVIDACIEE